MLTYTAEEIKAVQRQVDLERKRSKRMVGLPTGINLRQDGAYIVRVICDRETVEESVYRKLPDALEALREARIDVHNRQMIAIDKALEKLGVVL